MNIKQKINPKIKRGIYKFLDLLSDEQVVKLQYRVVLGRSLNLKKPKRFTEKIQWYKLNYRTPLMTICSDKYEIRNYLKQKGFTNYLPELYQVCEKYEEINFQQLPSSFVIKCNNGSGTNIFIKNKNEINLKEIKKTINSWKKVNTLSVGREWAYKNIKQKIIIEEMLIDKESNDGSLNDYKILCFNGSPKYAWVDIDRHSDHRRNFYDLKWNQLNVVSDHPNSKEEIKEPNGLQEMLKVSEEIAKDFPFARVDFYNICEKIYIGEITFYPWSGTVQFSPDEFDFQMGESFELPAKTIV